MCTGHLLLFHLKCPILRLQLLVSLGKGHHFISLLCIALKELFGVLLLHLCHLALQLFLLICLLCKGRNCSVLALHLFNSQDRCLELFGQFADQTILFRQLLDDCLADLFSLETNTVGKLGVFVL